MIEIINRIKNNIKNQKCLNIGFIGTGIMGKAMCVRLIDNIEQDIKINESKELAIYSRVNNFYVYNRTESKADPLIKKGAIFLSIEEMALNCDVIFTMVSYPNDVKEIYQSIFDIKRERQNKEAILIDMTTSSPLLAKILYQEAKDLNCFFIDAPVSGGDIGAKKGSLSIMVGGDREIFNEISYLFFILGYPTYQGSSGSGQHCKMANQITIASNMLGMTEALLYAKKAGLDLETVVLTIKEGAAGSWSLNNLAPRILKEDYEPGFYINHFIKDLTIALESAKEMKLPLSSLNYALNIYKEIANYLKDTERDDLGTQYIYKFFEDKFF